MKMERSNYADGVLIEKTDLREFLENNESERWEIYNVDDMPDSYYLKLESGVIEADKLKTKSTFLTKHNATSTANHIMDKLNMKKNEDTLYFVDRPAYLLIGEKLELIRSIKYKNLAFNPVRDVESFKIAIECLADSKYEHFLDVSEGL
jgi:hypothetical protein